MTRKIGKIIYSILPKKKDSSINNNNHNNNDNNDNRDDNNSSDNNKDDNNSSDNNSYSSFIQKKSGSFSSNSSNDLDNPNNNNNSSSEDVSHYFLTNKSIVKQEGYCTHKILNKSIATNYIHVPLKLNSEDNTIFNSVDINNTKVYLTKNKDEAILFEIFTFEQIIEQDAIKSASQCVLNILLNFQRKKIQNIYNGNNDDNDNDNDNDNDSTDNNYNYNSNTKLGTANIFEDEWCILPAYR